MISVTSTINWLGQKVIDGVLGDIDIRMNRAGQKFVDQVHATVHVKTGAMRAGAFYRVEDRTLILGDTAPHTMFEAFGTRFRPGHPQYLEAINSIGSTLGFDLEMNFVVPHISSPLIAHGGRFIVPSAIQPKPLTQAQHRHVRENLAPALKRLHRGNVKKAKMRVRRFD
jgi:hypothetical protein